MDADIKKIGTLGVVLLGLMIIIGVFFLVGDLWKENLCEQADYTYTGGSCVVSATNTTAVTLDSITNVNLAISVFVTALGFLSLIVIVAIAKILLKMVKGF